MSRDPETGERKTDYTSSVREGGVHELHPSTPVWVVVHGRTNSDESSQIAELARNLSALNVQVVTVDWHEGAADNRTPIGLEGSKWIETVGTWTANQLRAAGFSSQQINVIGNSWGSYVAYEVGAHIPGGVRTLLALDPAKDTPVLGGGMYRGFADSGFSFSAVAENSYAFHSSAFGNRKYALTATYAFEILSPENYEGDASSPLSRELLLTKHYLAALGVEVTDEVRDALREHGFAVSLFAEMLRRQAETPTATVASMFSPDALRSSPPEFLARPDHYEGTFFVTPSLVPNTLGIEAGQRVWKALQFSFHGQDAEGNDLFHSE